MGDMTNIVAGTRWRFWRVVMWSVAAFLLVLPAVAMQFTREVNWGIGDFVVMGVMLGSACGAAELAARASESGAYRIAAGIAIGATFLTVWVNLAVGMIGDEDNAYNLVFGGVLAVVLIGSILARLEAAAMTWAMAATALAQALAGAGGLATDARGGMLSMGFALLWIASAVLFRKASRDEPRPAVGEPA